MENRLRAIHDAAAALFIRQGYGRTQIQHIARDVGISVGTVYHDFASKEEIKNYIILCSIDGGLLGKERETPVTKDFFMHLDEKVQNHFDRTSSEYSMHLKDRAKDYPFDSFISDTFDMLYKYSLICLMIEKNPSDVGSLYGYYMDYRKTFILTVKQYLSVYWEKKEIRPLESIELTAVMIIEILSSWAMDFRYSSFEVMDISREDSKRICMDNIVNAYRS